MKTAEMCLAGVKDNSDAIKYVPDTIKEKVRKLLGQESKSAMGISVEP
jgi:hypothetical protein